MKEAKPLPFEIDSGSDVPLWIQLRRRIVHLINSGYFQPGDRLPTVRGLAADLAINFNTVNKVYLDLSSKGYLESARGRGVFVRSMDGDIGREHAKEIDSIIGDCVSACLELGLSLDEVRRCVDMKVSQLKRDEARRAASEPAGRIVEVELDSAGNGRKHTGVL